MKRDRTVVSKLMRRTGLFLFGLILFTTVLISLQSSHNQVNATANSNTINFQARLLTSSGAIVPDGTYNIDFRLYSGATGSPVDVNTSTMANCNLPCEWEETYAYAGFSATPSTYSGSVGPQLTVKDGYVSVYLGQYASFPSTINWEQPQYLTMDLDENGTTSSGTITWDGEMVSPTPVANSRIQLTSVPYAFTATQLATNNGTNRATLSFGTVSGNETITLPDVGTSETICYWNDASDCGYAPTSGSGNYVQISPGSPEAGGFNVSGTGTMGSAAIGTALDVGSASGTASPSNGTIVLSNTSSIYSTTIASGTNTSSYSLTLPIAPGQANQCIMTSTYSVSQLVYGACSGGPVIAWERTWQNQATPPGSSINVTDSPFAVGDLVVLGVKTTSNVAANKISINSSSGGINNWHAVSSANTNTGSGSYPNTVELFYGTVYATGSSTITVNFSTNPTASIPTQVMAMEFASGDGPGTIWQSENGSGGQNTASTTALYPNIASGHPGELYFGFGYLPGTATGVGGGGAYSNFTYSADTYNQLTEAAYTPNTTYNVSTPTYYGAGGIQTNSYVSASVGAYFYASAGSYINDGTSPQNGNFYVVSPGGGNPTGQLEGSLGNTSVDILDLEYQTGVGGAAVVDSFGAYGQETINAENNSVSSLQVNQTSSGSVVGTALNVDATNISIDNGSLAQPATPTITQPPTATPTFTQGGTACSGSSGSCPATYTYEITAIGANGGETLASPTAKDGLATCTSGCPQATLTTTNYNTVNFASTTSGVTYRIYRTTSTASTITSYGLIGSVLATTTSASFNDTGQAPTSLNIPTLSSTGALNTADGYVYDVVAVDSQGGQSPATTQSSCSTVGPKSQLVSWPAVAGARSYIIYRSPGSSSCTSGTETTYNTTTNNYWNDSVASWANSGTPNTLTLATQTGFVNNLTSNQTANVVIGTNGLESTGTQLYIGGSNPSTNVKLGSSTTTTVPQIEAVEGNNLYVGTASSGLQIYDISTPSSPILVDTYTGSGIGTNSITNIQVSGSYLYSVVANGGVETLAVVNISNPTSPTSVTNYQLEAGTTTVYQISLVGNYLYIPEYGYSTLQIVNIANPATPVLTGTVSALSTTPTSVAVNGNYAYLGENNGSVYYLQTINISNSSSLSIVGTTTLTSTNYAQNMAISGSYLYTDGASKFEIYNVANPANPVLTYTSGSLPDAVAKALNVYGNYLYIPDGTSGSPAGGTQIYDVSNPNSALLVGGINSSDYSNDAVVQGEYLFELDATADNLDVWNLGGELVQNLQAGSTETGGLTVDNNATINGDTTLNGSLSVGGATQLYGNVGIGGSLQLTGSLQGGSNLSAPSAPTIACGTSSSGCTTSTVYDYEVVAVNAGGGTSLSSLAGSISASDCTALSATCWNTVSWTAVTGATSYQIYRVVGGSTAGYIGNTATLSFTDTGLTAGVTVTSTPAAPTITCGGTCGTVSGTTYQYEIAAVSANGGVTVLSSSGSISANDCATLTTACYSIVTWSGVTNAVAYNIYRTSVTSGSPTSLGLIGTTTGTTTFNDTGLGTTVGIATAPTVTCVGTCANTNTSTYEIVALNASGNPTQASPSQSISASDCATLSSACYYNISWTAVSGAISYQIYRTAAGGTTPSSTGLIGNTTGKSFIDSGPGDVVSGIDSSGNLVTVGTIALNGTTNINSITNSASAFNINNAAGIAILSANTNLGLVNIAAVTPVYAGENSDSGNLSHPRYVYGQGNYVYVLNSSSSYKLLVYNISSGIPVYVGKNADGNISSPQSLYVQGNYAYVSNLGNSKLLVYNISSGIPVYVGQNSDSNLSSPGGVYVQGNYAYVVNEGNNNLAVYNISSGIPVYVGENSDNYLNQPQSVYVQGNYAYVANYGSAGASKIVVYNISSGTPVYVSENSDANLTDIYSLYVQGSYVYVPNYGGNNLAVYNISSGTPVYVGKNNDSNLSGPRGVYVQGNYAYVANLSGNNLVVYNISSGTPVYVGKNSDSNLNAPYSVYVQGNYAYSSASNSSSELVSYSLGGASIQQLSVGGITTGTLQVQANDSIGGSESVTGSLSVGGATQLYGNVGIGGSLQLTGSLQGGSNLSAPSAPTIACGTSSSGCTTSTVYDYEVVAVNAGGGTSLSSLAGSISASDCTALSATCWNTVSWTAVTGATSYQIYRVVGGSTAGYIGNTATLSFTDTGLTAGVTVTSTPAAPTITCGGTCGTVSGTTYQYEIAAVSANGGVTVLSSSGSISANDCATLTTACYSIVTWSGVTNAVAYNIYRTSVTSGSPTSLGLIGTTTGTTTFNDTGLGTTVGIATAPTIANVGTTGSATYQYEIVALNASGNPTQASPSAQTTSGNATLSSTNYNTITWTPVTGATSYDIYRTSVTSGTPSSTGLIGNITATGSATNCTPITSICFIDSGPGDTVNTIDSSGVFSAIGTTVINGSANVNSVVNSTSAFTVNNSTGINVLDVDTTGDAPTSITPGVSLQGSPISTGSGPEISAVNGSYLWVLNNTAGTFQAYNISNPGLPSAVGSPTTLNGGYSPYGIAFYGNYAYIVTGGTSKIEVYNISSPSSPSYVTTDTNGSTDTAVAVSGTYLYVGGPATYVYSLATPSAPSATGSNSSNYPGNFEAITVLNSTLYAVNSTNELVFCPLTGGGATITCAGGVSTYVNGYTNINDGNQTAISVDGNYLYVVTTTNNLLAFNATSQLTSGSTATGTISTVSGARGVSASGNYAWVVGGTTSTGNIQAFNISTPSAISSLGTQTTNNNPYSVSQSSSGTYAYEVNFTASTLETYFYTAGASYNQVTDNGFLSVTNSAAIAGYLTLSGYAKFQDGTNSSTALTVLNAAGTNTVLTVNTTADELVIGSGTTGENPPDLLVLDSGTSSDPTEVNGALYYNSSTGNFRCGETGTWENCIGGLLYSNTSTSSSVQSCTTACVAFTTTYQVLANYCVAGRVITLNANGLYGTTGTPTLAFGVYLGSNSTTASSDTLIGSISPAITTASGAANLGWSVNFNIICDAAPGASTSVNGQGSYQLETTSTSSSSTLITSGATTGVATNAAQNIYLFPVWSANSSSNYATVEQFIVNGQ